jgi:hypothetical protein
MSEGALAKVAYKTAAEVCQQSGAGDQARALLQDGMTPRQFLDALISQGSHADAVVFLAHALPKREAVWWACLCAEQILGSEPPPAAAAALKAARAWVIDPKDESRRPALPAAEAADLGTPAGCAALAAYFSGGSLAPPDLPAVPPGEHLTGKMVASSLALAAVIKQPEKSAEKYAAFLKIGLEMAEGRQSWPEPPKPASGEPTHGDARRARR